MSGTSLDGVDAVLVDFSIPPWKVIARAYQAFPGQLRTELLALQQTGPNEIHEAARAAQQCVEIYAAVVKGLLQQTALSATTIAAIGAHGQTVRHQPALGYSIQLNNPALLAELTGIKVVADFRSRDIAAGGQGAPLVPAFHKALFGHSELHRVIVNIGGIANLTDLPPHGTVRGFDIGPGNMLLDAWCQQKQNQTYDVDGQWAMSGTLIPELLNRMLDEPYFKSPPPKSTGRDLFNSAWLGSKGVNGHQAQDVQATLLELTAITITQAIDEYCRDSTEIVICGGGAKNRALFGRLMSLLAPRRVQTSVALGIQVDAVEAMAFAWLAKRALAGEAGNLPEVTGARGARVLGAIYAA